MLLKGTAVIENVDEGNLSKELEIAKFRNYGREKFSDLIQYEVTFKQFLKNSSNFYSINFPKELSDYFIREDIAPFFVLSESPIIKRIEGLLLVRSNDLDFVSNYREIRTLYHKWIIQKTPKEKQYISKSIVNSIERNFAYQSFFNVMIYGIILTYDKVAYNPTKAIELFERSEKLVHEARMLESASADILYLINIYKGFALLKKYEYARALETFRDAINYNVNGITAYFYAGLSARYNDDFDTAYDYLREIIEYDQTRFKYAINYNHLSLFSFFYENAIFYNVFTENGFAQLLPDIDFLIRSHYSGEMNSMEFTYGKLINLDNLRIKEFFNDAVIKEIKFLKNALNTYKQKRTGLVRIVEQIFRDKLFTLLEYIRNLIESHYFDQIKEEIIVFDKQIEQNKRQLTRIKLEMEDANKKIKTNLEEAAEYLEESITDRSKMLEDKINSMDDNPKFNSSDVFYSSMLFTIFISMLVAVVVGGITAIAGYGDEVASSQVAIKTAIRWGGLTFIGGIFISIYTTVSSYWEKNSEKKILISQLEKVKEIEAEERELIHEDSERKEVIYAQKFKDRIKTQEKIIQDFIAERDQNYNQKYSLAKKEIDQYIGPLNSLLKSLDEAG